MLFPLRTETRRQMQPEVQARDEKLKKDTPMSQSLTGRNIALAEGRQLEELATMLEKEGAAILRCPMVSIQDAPDDAAVVTWLRELIAGEFAYVVLMTGEGLRRLISCADRAGIRAEAIAALGRTRTVSRGPKPVQAMKEVGLAPSIIASPPTTAGVIATLGAEPLRGKPVGVQVFGAANPALEKFLSDAGARPEPVLPYVYAPAIDGEKVADLISRMARGDLDAVVFTSSPQVERLFEIAAEKSMEADLAAGLARTRVAAVGPIVADALRQRGAPVHICPEQGFVMKNLVKHIKDDLTAR
jgi:uroporphyrinogen-III synthase